MTPQGSVALVAGGASGLGAATARAIVERGGTVAILDLPDQPGAELAERLGERALFVPADVCDSEGVALAVDRVLRTFARLDVCVCCAAVEPVHRVVARDGSLFPLGDFRRAVDVNIVGLFDVVRQAAGAMTRNDPSSEGERGLIVNVASIAGYEGQIGQAAYAATKAAVIGLTLPLARDLATWGIRVVAVAPGVMATPRYDRASADNRSALARRQVFPKRPGRPEEFAELVCSLMENVLVNGEVVRLDGAMRL